MRKFTKLFCVSLMLLGLSASLFAQSTASATATARIISPIAISKVTDMNFGNIAISGAGTVTLSPAGGRTPSVNVTLPVITGTVTAASFDVTGEGASTYAITLPGSYTITRVAGTETMTVNGFTSTPSATGALTAGAQTITVGATLNISAGQVAGSYTNATGFDVTVNYN